MRLVPSFYRATIGKKVVMAVTGVVLAGWVLGHLLGNLLAFAGRPAFNGYAATMKGNAAILWGLRGAILVIVVLHITAAVQLVLQERGSRPVAYARKVPQESTYASRTLRWGGLLIAVFVVYHLLHFTTGQAHPSFDHADPYGNLVRGLSVPWVAAFYLLAVAALGLHLYHGVWSVFQTLGIHQSSIAPMRRRIATAFALIIYLGFSSIPLAILAGIVRLR